MRDGRAKNDELIVFCRFEREGDTAKWNGYNDKLVRDVVRKCGSEEVRQMEREDE